MDEGLGCRWCETNLDTIAQLYEHAEKFHGDEFGKAVYRSAYYASHPEAAQREMRGRDVKP